MKTQKVAIIGQALNSLTEQERVVIEKHVMGDKISLDEIGKQMGVSRQRIHQIKEGALGKLKRFLKNKRNLTNVKGYEVRSVDV